MPRMIDLVRKSQMSSNMMQAAARGALAVGPGEMIEILVHLSLHNRVFGELARMTLAGWDEKASLLVAADPATSKEVLDYLISPKNQRTVLLPALLENPSISDDSLAELATTGSRNLVEAMLVSKRVQGSPAIVEALRTNPRLRSNELTAINSPRAEAAAPVMVTPQAAVVAQAPQEAESASPPPAVTQAPATEARSPEGSEEDEQVLAQAIDYYLQANAAELATQPEQKFDPVPLSHEEIAGDAGTEPAETHGTPTAEVAVPAAGPTPAKPAAAPAFKAPKKPVPAGEERRDSTLQKIAKLDIKGRIALAVRGNKEERSILIRDGTKLVALAVLESPKITDGEVEKIALQKNVLETVLRAIPLKRRFAKNYTIMRNLVFNPRTPLDLSLGLMKNLLVHDLKNLSGNKEVPETIRKLALRMFKQKVEKKKDD